eukprot:gene28357-biopygen18140
MTIRSGKSYGTSKSVSAKFTIADSDFATLYNAAATTQLDLKLSVNSLISPVVSGEVSVLKGSELGSTDCYKHIIAHGYQHSIAHHTIAQHTISHDFVYSRNQQIGGDSFIE